MSFSRVRIASSLMWLLPLVVSSPTVLASSSIVDDGMMELTPEYNITCAQGQTHCEVYAAFTFIPSKKIVQLRADGSITVNGHALKGIPHSDGYYYTARIPAEGTFSFVLTRAAAQVMAHSFKLPELGISELPTAYRPYEVLRVPVQYVEPPSYVVSDTYNLSIYGQLRFTLASRRWKKDNRYQFDRLPNIESGAIVFKHIIERVPQPGVYSAVVYRQHHVVLSKMSEASRTGWAKLSNVLPFSIEVK